MHIEEITRDINKRKGWANQYEPIILRKGEQNETQIKVTVTDNDNPYSLSGMTAKFCAVLSSGAYVVDSSHTSVSGSVVTYTVQNDLTSADGEVAVAYIELSSGNRLLTTDTIPILVLKNYDLSTEQAQAYRNQIDALTAELSAAIANANNATSKANTSATKADTAANAANSAASSANSAASAANTATGKANTATTSANNAATAANTAADKANKAMETFKTIVSEVSTWAINDSGTTIPSAWQDTQPKPEKGRWLWERRQTNYNQGEPLVVFIPTYVGQDGEFAGDQRIDVLEERLDAVNDLTTGINLLRGTRDFNQGKTVRTHGSDATLFFTDGFSTTGGYTFNKDDNGFTVASVSASGQSADVFRYLNSSIFEINPGEHFTVSFDVKVEDVSAWDRQYLCFISAKNANGDVAFSSNILPSHAGIQTMKSGEWHHAVYYCDKEFTEPVAVVVRFYLIRNGSISFRKPCAYKGRINNPIWSASPFDFASGYNWNDDTVVDSVGSIVASTSNSLASTIWYDESLVATSGVTNSVGMIKVVLPRQTSINCMIRFKVSVYDYHAGGPCDYYVSGYVYNTNKNWIPEVTNAWSVSSIGYRNKDVPVKFGVTSDDYPALTIGNTDTTWSYCKVVISEIIANSIASKEQVRNFKILFGETSELNNIVKTIEKPWVLNDINDGTTGVNLLRYTRDFNIGSINSPRNQYLYANGFRKASSADLQGPVIGENGFTEWVLQGTGTTTNTTLYAVPLEHLASGTYTVSCEYKIEDVEAFSGNRSTLTISNGNLAADVYKPESKNTIQETAPKSGKWYKHVSTFTLMKDMPENGYVYPSISVGSAGGTQGKIAIRKICIYEGNIDNPIWSANPFDVAQVSEQNACPNGTYSGASIAEKFASEIGSNHIATWIQSRVKAANFTGFNIMDYVDIVLDGTTVRYRIAAIDPYYFSGSTQKGHHIVFVPDTPWILSTEKDGDYSIGGCVNWNKEADNNGTNEEKHPYLASNLHKWEIEKHLPRFPQEWQSAMLENSVLLEERYSASSKLTDSANYSWASLGKVWSLSEVEVYGFTAFGTMGYSAGSDCHFPIFQDTRRFIYRGSSSSRTYWWLRTVHSGTNNRACTVTMTSGKSFSTTTENYIRPLPCFMIG